MTNELEQNDDEVPGGLLGPLPGKDFKIGHIEVASEQTAGAASTDGK